MLYSIVKYTYLLVMVYICEKKGKNMVKICTKKKAKSWKSEEDGFFFYTIERTINMGINSV